LGSFGSLRYRDQAERELRKLGYHVHRRTRPGATDGAGAESLTERELQVAWLVADRKTNPQIAAELFLSQKAVETHQRNIFHKMCVMTRAALALRRTHRPSSEPATKIGPLGLLVLLVRRRLGCRKPKAVVHRAGRTPEWLSCATKVAVCLSFSRHSYSALCG